MTIDRRRVLLAILAGTFTKASKAFSPATAVSVTGGVTASGPFVLNFASTDTISYSLDGGKPIVICTGAQLAQMLSSPMTIAVPADNLNLTCTTSATGAYTCK